MTEQPANLFRRWWQTPTLVVTRLLLESYIKANWFWGEAVLVIVLFTMLFNPYGGDMSFFFSVGGSCLYGIAILGAAIMVRHSVGARSYIILARLTSRAAYTRGLILATAILRVPLFGLLLALALAFQRITQPRLEPMLIGAIGLLANCFLLSALTVAFSAPMASRLQRILLLGWLVLAATPIDQLAGILALIRLPLLPIAALFGLGITGSLEWFSLLALLIQAGYIGGAIFLAGYWLEKRELLLQ